jgi:NTE family protein
VCTIFVLAGLFAAFSGLIRGQKINSWLRGKLGKAVFSDTKIPFKAVAYDLVHREEIVLDRGSLVDAVSQSIAIPGVIQPVQTAKQIIIDGGVLNPLPTNVLRKMGITKIIAVNVLQTPAHVAQGNENDLKQLELEEKITFCQDPSRHIQFKLKKVITSIFTPNISDIIVRTLQATEYVIAEQSAKEANIVIHPNLVGIKWFELYKVDELIRLGEEATMQHLEAIKKLVKE